MYFVVKGRLNGGALPVQRFLFFPVDRQVVFPNFFTIALILFECPTYILRSHNFGSLILIDNVCRTTSNILI